MDKKSFIQFVVTVSLAGLFIGLAFGLAPITRAVNFTVCASGCDYTTIQAAIDAASPGDTIDVGAGTYNENITLKENLNLYGAGPHLTTIAGHGIGIIGGANGAVVAGLTIANDGSGQSFGYYPNVNLTVPMTFRNNVFSGHYVGVHAGQDEPVNIINNVFVNNGDTPYNGCAITFGWDNTPVIRNNIIVNNTAGIHYYSDGSRTPQADIDYNDVWNNSINYSGSGASLAPGPHDISANPLFVDAASGDYHLLNSSPAIDAGDPTSDYSNEPLPNGNRINMGVYGNTTEATPAWESTNLYGAQVELHNLVMADNGDLFLCLNDVGYGVYKLAKGATEWQLLESTGDGCRSMALDNVNNKLYRLASKSEPLWRSDDGGLNWTAIYTPSEPWSSQLIAINPITPTILHMAYGHTIHRSEDSGVSWTQAQFSPDGGTTYTNSLNSRIFRIAVDPGNPQYVYLTLYSHDTEDDKGIYVSANGGISYTRVITYEPWGYDLKVNSNGTVFASYNDGFGRSIDHGQTWDPLDITACTGDPNPHTVDYITFHPTLSQTIFIRPQQYGGCRSDDEGDTWTGNQEYWNAPLIDPSDTSTWYVPGTPGLWKSTDAWSTWSEMNEDLSEVAVRRIAASPSSPDRYWVMTGNGVGFTQDGGDTWAFPLRIYEGRTLESIDTWILTSNGGQVVFHPTDHNTVYLTQDENFYQFSDWTVTPWGEITPTLAITINAAKPELSAQDLVFDPTNPSVGYLAAGHIFASYDADGDGVYKTTNGGLTWNTTSLTLPIRSLLLVTHTTGITLYAGTIDADGIPGRIYRSTDDGDSWQMVEEFSGRSITTMAADPRQPLRVFAGTAGEGSSIGAFLYISQDGGETWSLADVAWPGCGGWIGNVAIDPKNPDHIYYAHATNGNICNSFDGGQTWENPSLFIWAQQWGIGQACVVDINHLPPGGSGLSVQAGETATQSLMYMGATSGIYRRILAEGENPLSSVYLPVILKTSS